MHKLAAYDPGEIVSSYHRGESVPAIVARHGTSREQIYQIIRYTRLHGRPPVIHRPGRRPRPPPWDADFLVPVYRRIVQLVSRALSRHIATGTGRVIPCTMIYRILCENGSLRLRNDDRHDRHGSTLSGPMP